MKNCTILAFVAVAATTLPVLGQRQYDSPEAAFTAVAEACAAGDKQALADVFGGKSTAVLEEESTATLHAFAEAYQTHHEILTKDNQRLIQVGEVGYVLPIPLVASDSKWSFDLDAAMSEIRKQRIGRDELTAIETLRGYVTAQRAYAAGDHDGDGVKEYAQRILSSEGQRDGLYFVTEPGEEPSPFGPLVAEKADYLKDKKPGDPYYGYYFKILRSQGAAAPGGAYDYVINGNMIAGFAMLAWPAEYGASGIMSFIVNHEGKVCDRDLGKDTAGIAEAMTTYQPEGGWNEVPADGIDESTVD
ncbi:MAG: DUF2950 domain-containing protein [Akkermansiaceae bacterium]|jgi:hypothetical protein|nr:DUF2950 domain-containing protein [Akkermansiaceae bacterium]MCU0776176.1 DUF2950 domain-containing protein [Akkermansiaceae bacterium]